MTRIWSFVYILFICKAKSVNNLDIRFSISSENDCSKNLMYQYTEKKEVAIAHRYELSLTSAERVMLSSCLVKYSRNIFLLPYSSLNVDTWFLKIIQVIINQIIMKKYNTEQHRKMKKTNSIKRNFW